MALIKLIHDNKLMDVKSYICFFFQPPTIKEILLFCSEFFANLSFAVLLKFLLIKK